MQENGRTKGRSGGGSLHVCAQMRRSRESSLRLSATAADSCAYSLTTCDNRGMDGCLCAEGTAGAFNFHASLSFFSIHRVLAVVTTTVHYEHVYTHATCRCIYNIYHTYRAPLFMGCLRAFDFIGTMYFPSA